MQNKIQQNGGTLIECDCGNNFFTSFPLETIPCADICHFCGTIHYQNNL